MAPQDPRDGSRAQHIAEVRAAQARREIDEAAFGADLTYGYYPTRRPNTNTGGSGEYAATDADWGFWIVEPFSRDPNAIAVPYKGAADFERQTGRDYEPID